MSYYRQRYSNQIKRLKKKCLACGSAEKLTCDHIFPRALDGISQRYNFMVLCEHCNNTVKGDQHPLRWLFSLKNPSQELEDVVFFAVKLHEEIFSGKLPMRYNRLGQKVLPDLEHLNCPNCGKDYTIPDYFKPHKKPFCNRCTPRKAVAQCA